MEAETIIKKRPLWRNGLWIASFLLCGGTVLAQAPKDVKRSAVNIASAAGESSVPFKTSISKVWVADLGNGKYKNPVLNADYSDPDAIRVGDDYYMIASSFDGVPGLPILHSKDLVNWSIIGHALIRQIPEAHFSKTQHGNGVWAPAIRYHKGEFYIYYPDPDFGIYLIKAKDPREAWSAPVMVAEGRTD